MGVLLVEPGNGKVFTEHNAYEAAHFSKSNNENVLHLLQDTLRELYFSNSKEFLILRVLGSIVYDRLDTRHDFRRYQFLGF